MPPNDSYKILVNGFTFHFTPADLETLNLVSTSPTTFNIIKDHQSVNARLLAADELNKTFTIETGGETFEGSHQTPSIRNWNKWVLAPQPVSK